VRGRGYDVIVEPRVLWHEPSVYNGTAFLGFIVCFLLSIMKRGEDEACTCLKVSRDDAFRQDPSRARLPHSMTTAPGPKCLPWHGTVRSVKGPIAPVRSRGTQLALPHLVSLVNHNPLPARRLTAYCHCCKSAVGRSIQRAARLLIAAVAPMTHSSRSGLLLRPRQSRPHTSPSSYIRTDVSLLGRG
jgi:hypothetical protein